MLASAALNREPELPSSPKLVALLLTELGRPEPDLRRTSQLFGADPALAMRLLRLANAVHREDTRGVISVAQALALLPTDGLRPLAEQAALASGPTAVPGLSLPQFWRFSLQVAKLARALAASVRQNQAVAYTAGLVHAVGELVLHAGPQEDMASVNLIAGVCDVRRAKLQQRMLGTSYAEVGAALAQQWQFPGPLVDALRYQIAPFDNDVYEPLAGLVHLAAWRARAQESGFDDRALATSFPGEVGLALGLDIDMVLQQDPIDWSGGHVDA
ncbi:HDOD domain-containing protein [Pseudorhodoferax sp.]|uniref:HDOD domain-containing protein n=1 Tax=Pseudorhodoferax sp. TaxID=1993553 RepID=UPI002DD64C0D|nr:HDOD domain-containing protein [Pseudorhodoferax sp.]